MRLEGVPLLGRTFVRVDDHPLSIQTGCRLRRVKDFQGRHNQRERLGRRKLVLRFIKPYPIKLDAEVQYCLLVRQAGRASEVGCQPTQKVSWAADERG